MHIIPRVAASAQLNIPGSYAQKTRRAFEMRDAFLRDSFSIMKKEGEISRKDMDCILGKQLPGVDYSVIPTVSPREYEGCVDCNYSDNLTIKSVIMELPFVNGALEWTCKTKNTLVHESTHLFEMLANPKILARDVALEIKKQDPDFANRNEVYESFYSNYLYETDSDLVSLSSKKKSMKKENYDSRLQAKMQDLQVKMKKRFSTLKAPRSEQVDVLQSYRNDLRLEYNARKAELDYAADSFEQMIANRDLSRSFYLEKLQAVEEILANILGVKS